MRLLLHWPIADLIIICAKFGRLSHTEVLRLGFQNIIVQDMRVGLRAWDWAGMQGCLLLVFWACTL